MYEGRTKYDAPEIDGKVFVNATNLKIGQIIKVRITDSWEYDLTAELI
jgi:ribosomal protein S12 methylthiotransferase